MPHFLGDTNMISCRATNGKPQPPPPPSLTPHRCVVLAVDTARKSGVAIYRDGRFEGACSMDIVSDPEAPGRWVRDAAAVGRALGLPVVLVPEKAYGGNTGTLGGLGAAYGVWRHEWLREGMSPKRIVPGVYPQVWRGPTLGTTRNPKSNPEYLHTLERGLASKIARASITDQDAAAAICIGYWASWAPKVLAQLPKVRGRKKK